MPSAPSLAFEGVPSLSADPAYAGTVGDAYWNTTTKSLHVYDGSAWIDYAPIEQQTFTQTVLAVATGTNKWYFNRACTFMGVDLSLATTGTTATTIDVKKSGTTIYTTTGNRPSLGSGVAHVLSTNPDILTIAAGDYITVDTVAIGTGAAGPLNATIRYRVT